MFFNFLLVSGLIFGAYYYGVQGDIESVDYYYLLGSLGVLSFLFLFLYYWQAYRPLRATLRQMQALLAGKPYQQIFTRRTDEYGILAHFFNQVTAGLGEVSSDLKDRRRMIDELTIASQLQRDILPLSSSDVDGLQISAKNRPATEVGGDSFNIFTKKGKTYIYIGDVTGHGVSAGLIMTMVNSLMSVFSDLHDTAYDVMVQVNKYIKQHIKKAMFMTMVLLSWDNLNKKMTFVGAGHEHILVYRAATGQVDAVLSGGVALGMVPDNSKIIKEKQLELEEGDVVILFTDGITEARNKDGELFGLESLKKAIVEYAPEYSADGINYHIAKDASNFMKGHKQDDDMTLIVMKRSDTSVEKSEDTSTSW
ncbi:SpoIIE family protein phosphatase [Candidatus Peregrinibacteria bacterium]|nr:SpoIIE family protein phosphatase [Candidatus Peregrinibacteria bacterium]